MTALARLAPLALALLAGCPGESPTFRDGAVLDAVDLGDVDLATGDEGVADAGPQDPLALATRLSLDDNPVRVGRRAIAFDSQRSGYVVAWDRLDVTSGEHFLVVATVAADGSTIFAPKKVATLTESSYALAMRLLVVGGKYYVWLRGSSDEGRALVVSENSPGELALAHEAPFPVSAGSDNRAFGVDWDGNAFGLLVERRVSTQNDRRQLFMWRLGEDLKARGTEIQLDPSNSHQRWPDLLWVDGHYVALWVEGFDLRAARVSTAPALLDTTPPTVAAIAATTRSRAAADGAGGVLVFWPEGERACRALHLSSDLAPLWDPVRSLVPENRFAAPIAALASSKDRVLVAWASDLDDPLTQILAARVDLPTGDVDPVLGSGEPLSARHLFTEPAVAAGSNSFGVVFSGTLEGAERLYFRALPR